MDLRIARLWWVDEVHLDGRRARQGDLYSAVTYSWETKQNSGQLVECRDFHAAVRRERKATMCRANIADGGHISSLSATAPPNDIAAHWQRI